MRSYPCNSPHAAARIVALALICDGHLCCSEIDALKRLDVAGVLGLSEEDFARVVQTLCEDQMLPLTGSRPMETPIAHAAIDAMLAEVDDPGLQRTVMHLAMAATVADRHLADGEIDLMQKIFQRWNPAHAVQRTLATHTH